MAFTNGRHAIAVEAQGRGGKIAGTDIVGERHQRSELVVGQRHDDQLIDGVVAKLRDVQGSGWKDVADLFAEFTAIRSGNDSKSEHN